VLLTQIRDQLARRSVWAEARVATRPAWSATHWCPRSGARTAGATPGTASGRGGRYEKRRPGW